MDIYNHELLLGNNKNKKVRELVKTRDGLESLDWYLAELQRSNAKMYNEKYNEIINSLEPTLLNHKFSMYFNDLKSTILSYHDDKAQNERLINPDYLEYLALKYANKTMNEIKEEQDIVAIKKILDNI